MTQRSTTDNEKWVSQLEQLTKDSAGEYVTLEILHPAYGDEPEAERLPFTYAADDPRDDVVIIAVGGQHAQVPSGAPPPDLTPRKSGSRTTR